MINENKIEFIVKYKNKEYAFSTGSEAYIFHTGIYNGMDEKHGVKALLDYVALVQSCYLSDNNRTPLGALADYAAENWKRVKRMSDRDIIDRFYNETIC